MQGGMKGPMADMMKAMMGGQDMPDMEEMQSKFFFFLKKKHKSDDVHTQK